MTLAAASVASNIDTVTIEAAPPGYAIAPNAVIRDASLSLTARLLYVVLDGRGASKAKGQRLKIATLAEDLGRSHSAVSKAAAELREAGLLVTRRTGASSSWRLTNEIRKGKGASKIAASLARNHEGHEGNGGRDHGDHGARSVASDGSDLSLTTDPQSITRENYNSSADVVRAPASGGALADDSQRRERSVSTDHGQGATRTAAGARTSEPVQTAEPAAQPGGDKKTAKDAAPRELAAVYLGAINAATGANLHNTQPLRVLIGQIHAKGISAKEAAADCSMWLAAKGSKIASPAGFLAHVALPALANGEPLQEPAVPVTPTPPAFRELTQVETCEHGAQVGRCALCRVPKPQRPQQAPQVTEMAARWQAVMDALKIKSRVAYMVFSESRPLNWEGRTLTVGVPEPSKASNARASGHDDRLAQALLDVTGLSLVVDVVTMAENVGSHV